VTGDEAPRAAQLPPIAPGPRNGLPWEEREAILLIALTPASVKTQDYDQRRGWVIELAELIGRTPGSISTHLGNVWTLKNGRGLTHVGGIFDVVYRRYVGREDDLLRDAANIRAELYARAIDPRVEVKIDSDLSQPESDRIVGEQQLTMNSPSAREATDSLEDLEKRLKAEFAEARLPVGSVIVYRRKGSIWVGVLVSASAALLLPERVKRFLVRALEILGPLAERSSAALLAIDDGQVALADRTICNRIPDFRLENLTPKDRITLAIHLVGKPTLANWKPSGRRLELFGESDGQEERNAVSKYLHIDASKVTIADLMRLLKIVDEGKKKKAH
jgi:hypothetical protein